MRILGIDPSLTKTGWGILTIEGNSLLHEAHGTIATDSDHPMGLRLATIFQELAAVIKRYSPEEAALEETFLNSNPKSTLKLGMARGVAFVCPPLFGIPVFEYSATKVKKSLVGAGHADKNQVMTMVNMLLPQAQVRDTDAADALAVAITHAHSRTLLHQGCSHDCKAHGHS